MRDILAGLFLGAFALLFVLPGIGYGVGTISRPGSGGVPVIAGLIMLSFAALIAFGGIRRLRSAGETVRFEAERLRHIAFVMAALGIFALMIERFGLLPSTAAAVIISSLADRESRIGPTLVVAAVMCVVVWVIFKLGLQVKTPLIESPF